MNTPLTEAEYAQLQSDPQSKDDGGLYLIGLLLAALSGVAMGVGITLVLVA